MRLVAWALLLLRFLPGTILAPDAVPRGTPLQAFEAAAKVMSARRKSDEAAS
jgi:hypothetical protein